MPLEGDAKRSAFRIHRDVRFSRDKRPYKTEVGVAWFRPGGSKGNGIKGFAGVLYFHLSASGCFSAVAFHNPDPESLDAIREAIRVRPAAFLAVQETLATHGLSLATTSMMTKMPRGFEDLRDSEVAAALRLRSYGVSRPVPGALAQSPGLITQIADLATDALPLLHFGWFALDEARGTP